MKLKDVALQIEELADYLELLHEKREACPRGSHYPCKVYDLIESARRTAKQLSDAANVKL